MNNTQEFRSRIIAALGFAPEVIQADGAIHRFATTDKRRDLAGWYVMHDDGLPAGAFGCWRDGSTHTWCSKAESSLTEDERAAHQQRVADMRAARDAERQRLHDAGRFAADLIWRKAGSRAAQHPYIEAKGIRVSGAKCISKANASAIARELSGAIKGELLAIPMRDAEGTLWNIQFIDKDGIKRPLTGARIKGCYYAIGKPAGEIVVCEGFATGASIHEATGKAVAVAFNTGNLLPVAQALRAKYPGLQIIVAADDDIKTEGNPGLKHANEAAQAVSGVVAAPVFPDPRPDGVSDFNDLHQLSGPEAVKRCIAAAQSVAVVSPAAWPAPRDIKTELPPAPDFDAKVLLPDTLANFVLDEADRMPCAPDYIAAALIVCLGSVIGARCAIKPKRRDDWIVTPNLFGGIVGDPSVKKSPALGTVTRFLDRLEAKEAEKLAERQKVYEAELAAFEAHQSAVKASMKKAASGKGDGNKMALAINDMQAIEAPEEPHQRRFKSNDSTVEKLGDLLTTNPQGLLVFRDELIGLLASWEKEGREGDKAFYLEGWNGTGSFNIDRIARGSLYIPHLCLSVFGGIQPELLERYLTTITNSLDNDGRIQRFQVLVYPDAVKWQWRDRYPVKGAREAVRDLFDRLADFDPVMDGATPADDFVKLPHFHFDDAAQEIFVEWTTELNAKLLPGEPNPMMQQHYGKFDKLFCAIALILHVAEGRIGPVQADSALRAAAWCEYLAAHARRVYGLVEASKVKAAQLVGRRLAGGKLDDGFTVRDLVRKQWSGIGTSLQAETALGVLEEHAWIVSADTDNPTGRPTTRYYINPQVRRAAA